MHPFQNLIITNKSHKNGMVGNGPHYKPGSSACPLNCGQMQDINHLWSCPKVGPPSSLDMSDLYGPRPEEVAKVLITRMQTMEELINNNIKY